MRGRPRAFLLGRKCSELQQSSKSIVLNGKTFYLDESELMEEIKEYLERFSLSEYAEDEAYTVYFDGGSLIVY